MSTITTTQTELYWTWYKGVLGLMFGAHHPITIAAKPDPAKLIMLATTERHISGFDERKTLTALGYTKLPFNPSIPLQTGIHGYSSNGKVSITRATNYPTATLWHELGHLLCEHEQRGSASDPDFRPIAECEAELVAYLCAHLFDYPEPKSDMRGYIKTWSERNPGCLKRLDFGRIYTAVDRIKEANK